jgi:hypothetical protein
MEGDHCVGVDCLESMYGVYINSFAGWGGIWVVRVFVRLWGVGARLWVFAGARHGFRDRGGLDVGFRVRSAA